MCSFVTFCFWAGAAHGGVGALNQVVQVILVVEDDEQIQSLVDDTLTEAGFEPAVAPSGEER